MSTGGSSTSLERLIESIRKPRPVYLIDYESLPEHQWTEQWASIFNDSQKKEEYERNNGYLIECSEILRTFREEREWLSYYIKVFDRLRKWRFHRCLLIRKGEATLSDVDTDGYDSDNHSDISES